MERPWGSPVYLAWRRKVLVRDRYRCRMPGCRSRSRSVQVHHIRRYADVPGAGLDPANGITLCRACHKKVTGQEGHWSGLLLSLTRPGQSVYLDLLFRRQEDKQ